VREQEATNENGAMQKELRPVEFRYKPI